MTIIDFRNDFLAEVETRLAAFDIEEATDNELLAKGALYKMASNVATEDLLGLSALRKLETLNGAQLETWLGDLSNLAAFYQALANGSVMAAIASNSTAMTAITGSGKALNAIISNSAALTAVASNPAAWSTFKAGTGLTAAAIPTMTSNTAPSGVASSSTQFDSGYAAWYAFEKSTGNWLASSNSVTNQWIQYVFPSPVFIHTFTIDNTYWSSNYNSSAKNIKLQYSNDGGATWQDAVVKLLPSGVYSHTFDVIVPGRYAYWRLFIVDNWSDSTYLAVREWNVTGFQ